VAAGAGEDYGCEVAGDYEGVAVVVFAQDEGEFQGGDGGTDGRAVAPGLAEDGGFAVGGEGVEIRLAVVGIHGQVGGDAGLQGGALFVGEGVLEEAGVFSPDGGGDDELSER